MQIETVDEVFETFHNIKNPQLRDYNRVVMLCNIQKDFGKVFAEEYLQNFTSMERIKMMLMLMHINKVGRDEVVRTLKFEPELTNDEVQYV